MTYFIVDPGPQPKRKRITLCASDPQSDTISTDKENSADDKTNMQSTVTSLKSINFGMNPKPSEDLPQGSFLATINRCKLLRDQIKRLGPSSSPSIVSSLSTSVIDVLLGIGDEQVNAHSHFSLCWLAELSPWCATDEFLLNITEKISRMSTLSSYTITIFVVSTLLTKVRTLEATASRILFKAITTILSSHRQITIKFLLARMAISYYFQNKYETDEAERNNNDNNNKINITTNKSNTFSMELCQRIIKQVKIKDHILFCIS